MTRTAGALIGRRRSSAFWGLGCPKTHHEIKDSLDHLRLLQTDHEFKRKGINPGTSADLTVATLFIAHLESLSTVFEHNTGSTRVRDSRPNEVGIRS
ncbi:MAG: triphosphoribosyl-dephospho-CoA synthase [Candidatus Thiodiazotropha sp. L084R]